MIEQLSEHTPNTKPTTFTPWWGMPCLWGLFKWRKRRRSHKDERELSLENLDRETLLHSWDNTHNDAAQSARSPSNLEERYVRFGIGGAGNMRKSATLIS